MKKILTSIFAFILAISLTACSTVNKNAEKKELKKVDFVLDWAINTNHTGLYVAKEKDTLLKKVSILILNQHLKIVLLI